MSDSQVNKGHRTVKAGRGSKAAKAAKHAKATNTMKAKHNPKAFGVANTVRTKRNMQRNLDASHQKEYLPATDRRVSERPSSDPTAAASEVPSAPPITVVVHGPPGSGKSTLLRTLALAHTNRSVTPCGPMTLHLSKTRRATFIECPASVSGAIDLSKVGDLNVLVVNAQRGLEMETFEYLNLLQQHGLSKCCLVLTHLDTYKTQKSLNAVKKKLKDRFWSEVYPGAKVFPMNGHVTPANAKYLKTDVRPLSLFLQRVKFRPLHFRNTRWYVVADRHEVASRGVDSSDDDDNETVDVAFYGYLKGSNLRPRGSA
eukprot:CAMPEP_0197555812 /NCGR_PEP_ID=MMETSP1320-20131121/13979_1 /TAXON_ID=91990 /ORGANISM="Bolidomonas sp., Strain RCC2347" /LENGTH=313 /DNA_ID=CAMNT_0043116861 /DNA_START=32 /DNA_END=970 /DNA_ORIENTATION=-